MITSGAVAKILCPGGGGVGGSAKFFEPRSGEENCFGRLLGSRSKIG